MRGRAWRNGNRKLRPEEIRIGGLNCVRERLDGLSDCYERKTLGLTNEIPEPDCTFDAIVAGAFLEHLYPSDVDPTLCEFQRILKIGGTSLLTTPKPYSPRMQMRKGSVYGVAHLTQHSPKILRTRLMSHGFSNIRLIGSGSATCDFGNGRQYYRCMEVI